MDIVGRQHINENAAREEGEQFIEKYGSEGEWPTFLAARRWIEYYYEEWLEGKKNIDPEVGETAKLCAYYSPTWLSILIDDPEETGGFISLAFTPFPEETHGFEQIYPQDIAIYCARIDALRHPDKGDYIKRLFSELHYDPGFQKFSKATMKFVFSGMLNRIKAKVFFWRTPKWERVRNDDRP